MAKRKTNRLTFEASAYLQTLIGRELFRSQELAVVELVKNAYDSGAETVDVLITVPSAKGPGEIVVRDNGDGTDVLPSPFYSDRDDVWLSIEEFR